MSQVSTRSGSRIDGYVGSVLSAGLPLLSRIALSAVFVLSGAGKLAAPAATLDLIASAGLPFVWLAYAGSVLVELVGGSALIVGYRTRSVALVLAVFSLATAIVFHSNFADQNQLVHFLKNIAMFGGLLHVVALGPDR